MSEASGSEMHSNPETAVGPVLEEIDIVIARSDRPELLTGEIQQLALRLDGTMRDRVDHLVIDGLTVSTSHTERQRAPEHVHDASDVDIGRLEIRLNGAVAARDVIPDTSRHDRVLQCDHAPYGHGITGMMIGAEDAAGRGGSGRGQTRFELFQAASVWRSEDDGVGNGMHGAESCLQRPPNRVPGLLRGFGACYH